MKSIFAKKIFNSFTIYTSSNFINQAIPFLLLPFLTRFLSPYNYGILATFMAMMRIINVIASMGTSNAVTRGYFDREEKHYDFPKFIFNAVFVNIIIFLILIIALFFLKSFISKKLFIPSPWLFSLPVIGFCLAIYVIPFKLFAFRQHPLIYATFQISNTSTEILLSIFFVMALNLNWQGRVLGIYISRVLFLLIGVFLLFKHRLLNFSIDYQYIKNILYYGAPIMLHLLDLTIVSATDRFFLNRFVSLSATGIYSVGYSIAAIIGFFLGSFNLAWVPILYEKLTSATDAFKIKLVKFTYLYFVLIFLFAVALIIITPHFLRLFVDEKFHGASKFVFWIALGYAFHGMYTMTVNYIFYQKRTYVLAITTGIIVVLNIVLNYILIRLNGAIGAAQATFITFVFRFLLIWFFSNRVYPMPWFSFIRIRSKDRDIALCI